MTTKRDRRLRTLKDWSISLQENLEEKFNITDLYLPDSFWPYALDHKLIAFNKFEEPIWEDTITLPLLIKHKAEFYFPTYFDFYSNTHPDCLAAPLARSLALAELEGQPYPFDTGEPLSLPLWAYPNKSQLTLELK